MNIINKNFINKMSDRFLGPYVPPCERHPYYDDPRDVKQNTNGSYDNPFVFNDFYNCINDPFFGKGSAMDTEIDKVVDLRQCPKCGTYFQPLNNFDSPYCFDCRESQ